VRGDEQSVMNCRGKLQLPRACHDMGNNITTAISSAFNSLFLSQNDSIQQNEQIKESKI